VFVDAAYDCFGLGFGEFLFDCTGGGSGSPSHVSTGFASNLLNASVA
jgi:hypothetical protein